MEPGLDMHDLRGTQAGGAVRGRWRPATGRTPVSAGAAAPALFGDARTAR
ncbi:hypothetical protein GCM10023224_48010 [Streptomonospora halophila]|uniref:Uncharacterized protein n=1 Tax=Streptomonospora halophila TaxID=427369 RepID=A0ABP9GZA8_9ACTN